MAIFKSIKFFIAVVTAALTIVLIGFIGDRMVVAEELRKDAVAIEVAEAAIETEDVKSENSAEADTKKDSTEQQETEEVAAKSFVSMVAEADLDKGKKIARSCGACHSFKKGGAHITGPNLWGIVGMEKASKDGFSYSKAMKESEGVWSYDSLDKFMLKPKDYIPGTKMMYRGIKKIEDRAALIAWLRMQADEPAPLED